MRKAAKNTKKAPPGWNDMGVNDQIGTEDWWRENGQWIRAALAIANTRRATVQSTVAKLARDGHALQMLGGLHRTILECVCAAEMLQKVANLTAEALLAEGYGSDNPIPRAPMAEIH